MPRKVIGGSAQPVLVIGSEDLIENGGNFKLAGGVAKVAYGVPTEEQSVRPTLGGAQTPVYLVSDNELRENGGNFKLEGGSAEPIAIGGSARGVSTLTAIPVYAINLDAWISPVKFVGSVTGSCSGSAITIDVSGLSMETNFLMVASIVYEGDTDQTITAPSGWITVYEEFESGQGWLGVYYDFYDGTDSHEWTFSDSSACQGGISVYSCVDTNTPIDTVGTKGNGNDEKPKAPSVNPNKKGTKVIQFVGASGTPNWTPSDSWIKRWQNGKASTGDKGHRSGATGDIESTLDSAAVWQSVMVAVSPCDSIAVGGTVELRLTWVDNSADETGFLVQRGPDGSSWTTVATLAADTTTWDDTNVDTGQTLYYRVLAYNDDGNSDPSNTASITI
jgi:hypothetical protein